MRVNSFPSWIPITRQEAIIFDLVYQQPEHEITFAYLFELALKVFPTLAKSRLSDVLRHIEAKQLVERGKRHGDWKVTADTKRKVLAQARKSKETEKAKDDE